MLLGITIPGTGIDITGFIPAGVVGIAPLLLLAFVAFVLVFKAVLGFLKNVMLIVVAAVAFPAVLYAAGYSIPLTLGTFVGFAVFGVIAYAAFAFIRLLVRIFSRKK